ncbi:hypothetical protein [Paenibacillus sp. P36]|uniref:hypothetical protein n=1 Tax=Paenibacillus sp. P36 TaxID=3342538 RepID=UPI0038B35AEA
MNTTKNKDLRIAYVINERKFKELEAIMKNVSEDITYDVDCIDGTSIVFTSLDDLLKFPNRKEKQYKRIEVSTPYLTDRISITFSNYDFRSISYRVSGDERNVDFYSGQVESFLMSLRPWYSFIGAGNFISSMIGFFLLFMCLTYILVLLNIYKSIDTWGIIIISIIVYSLYEKMKGFLFPVASFELGDGIERVKMKGSIRNLILGSIGLAGVLGFLVNQIPPLRSLLGY